MSSLALSLMNIAFGLLALLGLIIWGKAEDTMFAFFGFGLMVLFIVLIFVMIRRYVGAKDAD